MPATARRTREKLQRYEEIVSAAEKVFFSKGYAHTSMDEIAIQAQLSRALLYVYFKDKAAIMRAVMLRACQFMLARFEAAAAGAQSGADKIRDIGLAYYAYSVDDADYFDLMTEMNTFPMPEEPDEVTLGMVECRDRVHNLMVSALTGGISDGSIDPEHVKDPELTAQILRGSLHGVIMFTRKPADHEQIVDSKAMVNEAIEMMCYAMRQR